LSIVQAITTDVISFGTTLTADFTADFTDDGGSPAASDPTAGNSLVVWLQPSQDVTAVILRNSGGSTVTTMSPAYSPPSDGSELWLANDIGSGIVDIQITLATDGNCTFYAIEDDQALTLEDTVDFAASGEGFVTVHDYAYTAATSDELAFASGTCSAVSNASTSGTNRLIKTTTNFGVAYYKDITSSGAGQIDITVASNANHNATLVTLSRASGTSPLVLYTSPGLSVTNP
jgi:hypothetical protein